MLDIKIILFAGFIETKVFPVSLTGKRKKKFLKKKHNILLELLKQN
jgi:hypothetical protein